MKSPPRGWSVFAGLRFHSWPDNTASHHFPPRHWPCKQFALWPLRPSSPPLLDSLTLLFALEYSTVPALSRLLTISALSSPQSPCTFVLSFRAFPFPLKLIRFSAGITKEKRATLLPASYIATCHKPPHHPTSAAGPFCLAPRDFYPFKHWEKLGSLWFL